MHRPEPEFIASTFIAELCLDANGDLQLSAGDNLLELRLADDESPEALCQIRVEYTDATEFLPWQSSPRPD
jgi:hypothetical protein